MNDNGNNLFTTGQFARLCGTTKDTLFYYDQIGILKPKYVTENGYRRYTSGQFFDYDLISVLKQAGSSLKEIKWYFEHYDTVHFLHLFQEKQLQIVKQRRQLEQMEKMLTNTIATTIQALSETYDTPRIAMENEEWLLVVKLAFGDGDSADSVAIRLGEHFARCQQYQLSDKFPLGSIILKEQVLQSSDEERYFFSKASADIPQEHLYHKPAGRYATIIHKGDYSSFATGYQTLLKYINDQNLIVCGNCYVYDLVSYLASGKEENFILKISIQIK